MIFTPIERTLADTQVGYKQPQRQNLLQIEGLSNTPASPAPNIGVCTYLTDDNTASVVIGLKEHVLSHGFRTNLNIEAGLCSLKKIHSFILDPMGVLYKCPAHVGHSEFAVGHIGETTYNSRYAMFIDSVDTVWHQCSECEFAPTCAGGCPHEAYLEYGTFSEKACHKPVLTEMSAATIRMQYATMQTSAVGS
ncbi:MAG: SPASM domain-containing protein [Candidatus Latescibacteria bacterium]|nr:SPASM domain-containing protein [Candidatus Latescibacterota bacterium]